MYIYTIILTWLKHWLICIGCFYWNILYMKTFIIWSVKGHFRFRKKYKMNYISAHGVLVAVSTIHVTVDGARIRTNNVTEINMLQAFTMYYQKPLIDIYIYMEQLPTEQALLKKKKLVWKWFIFSLLSKMVYSVKSTSKNVSISTKGRLRDIMQL